MEPSFWHQRWTENQIGFHQANVNSRLMRLWPQLKLDAGVGVFVPLCGKSLDMLWLARQGFRVIGVELSESACEAFFRENDLPVSMEKRGAFNVYSGSGIELLAGDFFDLSSADLAGATAVYDRAALVALPAAMRKDYTDHLAAIVPEGGQGLCISMSYDQEKMKGPPFSVPESEVRQLFDPEFKVTILAESSGPEIVGNLRDRGLDTLDEKIYHLVRRGR